LGSAFLDFGLALSTNPIQVFVLGSFLQQIASFRETICKLVELMLFSYGRSDDKGCVPLVMSP
jgi:hypothetical protein